MRLKMGWIGGLLLALMAAGGAAAAPVGMACYVKGKAELRRPGQKTYQGLRLLQ